MQRIRKDSETSTSAYSALGRGRRESDRFRGELIAAENMNTFTHRNSINAPVPREVMTLDR